MSGDSDTLADFATTFKGFMEHMTAHADVKDSVFLRRLREHFRTEPTSLPVVGEKFPGADHANVHQAVDALVRKTESCDVVGVASPHGYGVDLSTLVSPEGSERFGVGVAEAPVQYVNLPVDQDQVLACVQSGLFLLREKDDEPLAVLIQGPTPIDFQGQVTVEIMALERGRAERFLASAREFMRAKNVYRGKVISLDLNSQREIKVAFHYLPKVRRDDIILPDGLLERIERHSVRFAEHRERLRKAGRHLKRGLLLHGPPGTGKTLTAMYIASLMVDRTVLLLTGPGMGLIKESCRMARALEPATVIIEDVDLVATAREQQTTNCNTVLFDLLNQMDGLSDDSDILFLLTTNRADILEPALASRPGRIDLALEIPLPDAVCRRRLVALYGEGLALKLEEIDKTIEKTEGVSAAFIREMLRRAALVAADESDEIEVADRHVRTALHELLVEGGALTQSLLGARLKWSNSNPT